MALCSGDFLTFPWKNDQGCVPHTNKSLNNCSSLNKTGWFVLIQARWQMATRYMLLPPQSCAATDFPEYKEKCGGVSNAGAAFLIVVTLCLPW